jgi:hypothetical protein
MRPLLALSLLLAACGGSDGYPGAVVTADCVDDGNGNFIAKAAVPSNAGFIAQANLCEWRIEPQSGHTASECEGVTFTGFDVSRQPGDCVEHEASIEGAFARVVCSHSKWVRSVSGNASACRALPKSAKVLFL